MNKLVDYLDGYTAVLFQTDLSPHDKEHYERRAKSGDMYAVGYLEFFRAREEEDFHKLADFIPDNWIELYADEYRDRYPAYKKEFLDMLAEEVLGKPTLGDATDEDEIYRLLAREFGQSVEEVRQTNRMTIEGITRTRFFLHLFGKVLPEDENGEPMIPSPIMGKLLGISYDEAETLIMEYLPLSFDHHSTLSKISSAPFFSKPVRSAS